MTAPKLLLLEILKPQPFDQVRGEALPFLLAWAKEAGVPARAVSIGIADDDAPLGDAERVAIAEAARGLGATHLLSTEPLPPAVQDHLGELNTETLGDRFVLANGELLPWLSGWLGVPAPDKPSRLVDAVTPDFATTPLNERAAGTVPPIRAIAGAYEQWQHPVSRSPFFQAEREAGGFYISNGAAPYPYKTPARELAIQQIEAAQATLPEPRQTSDVMIHGAEVVLELDTFIDDLTAAGRAPLNVFFSVQPAVIVQAAQAIDAALAKAKAASIRLGFGNIYGVNLSEAECERLGAPTTPADFVRADDLLSDWERRYPETFLCLRVGGFGMALFTPWTTLRTLRDNLAIVSKRIHTALPRLATSKLRIAPGSLAAQHAEADGLLTDGFDPDVFGPHPAPDTAEGQRHGLPWRFEDANAARVYTVAARVAPLDLDDPPEDRYHLPAQNMRGMLPQTLRDNPVATLALLVDAAESLAEDASDRDYFEHILATAGIEDVFIGLWEEEGEEEPPEDEDEAKRDAKRLAAHLDNLDAQGISLLQGYRPETIVDEYDTEGHRVIAVTLRFGDERLVVNLLPRRVVRGSFAFTTKYAICYHQETPIDTREKELAVQALTEMVEKSTT